MISSVDVMNFLKDLAIAVEKIDVAKWIREFMESFHPKVSLFLVDIMFCP